MWRIAALVLCLTLSPAAAMLQAASTPTSLTCPHSGKVECDCKTACHRPAPKPKQPQDSSCHRTQEPAKTPAPTVCSQSCSRHGGVEAHITESLRYTLAAPVAALSRPTPSGELALARILAKKGDVPRPLPHPPRFS